MAGYNSVQKAYDLLVGFHHLDTTVDFDEVIGYLGEALDDHPDEAVVDGTVTTDSGNVVSNSLSEYPCQNCGTGWGSISTEGSSSCHDTCERLKEYYRRQGTTYAYPNKPYVDGTEILDSGERTEFPSGAVRDMREGKGNFAVMPLEVVAEMMHDNVIHDVAEFMKVNDTKYLYRALCRFALEHYMNEDNKNQPMNTVYADMCLDVAVHYEQGAKKYGPDNWRKSIPVWCYIDSAVRHYLKVLRGDTDEAHSRAFVWNIMCCIWEVDHNKKETEDA